MLIVDRPIGTSVCIGENIRVRVWRSKFNSVVLGIEAPKVVPIYRDELAFRPSAARDKKLRVGVVEDDDGHRDLFKMTLEDCGLKNVTFYSSGEAALAAWENPDAFPQLVLMDLILPGISGIETLRRLRQTRCGERTPVLMLSSHDNDEQVRQCLEAGAAAFVVKEAGYDAFQAAISRIAEFWAFDRLRGLDA